MEFAGFHLQHQLQEESRSAQCITSATPPEHNKPSTTPSWIPSSIYNNSYTNGFLTESFTNSRELEQKYDSVRTSTGQAFGFHDGKSFTQQPASEPQQSPCFFSSRHVTRKEEYLPAENLYHVQKPIDGDGGMGLTTRYNFGGVSSISNLPTPDMNTSLVSCSLGLNSEVLDLHTSYSGSYGLQLCHDTFGLNKESKSLSHGNMHGHENSPSNSSNKIISSLGSEVTMTKRPSNCSRPKECETKAKKSRSSCPPLKVRTEKLGDRIQTLQRLVAPFGKTSTVSVLSEAIGYIHFLHEQIQTLSIPYMKLAQSKSTRMMQLESKKVQSREFKPDLRSRGLCLVPFSYASFIHRCD